MMDENNPKRKLQVANEDNSKMIHEIFNEYEDEEEEYDFPMESVEKQITTKLIPIVEV